MASVTKRRSFGLVLAGGGARGAYEVGVLSGLREILATRQKPLHFDTLVGSSIGALNAAWLGAHAHLPHMGIDGLVKEWLNLKLEDSVRLHLDAFRRSRPEAPRAFSLLDASALEQLARERIPWTQLHYNLASSALQALVVTALNIGSGQTTMFAQLAPDAVFRASRDPRRNAQLVRIRADHVLASSAFPWLFPAREIDGAFFCDGGLRLNTPIAPALRVGADKLVVISLKSARKNAHKPEAIAAQQMLEAQRTRAFPSPMFLLGKLLNALLLDPIEYDLQVLERFNRLVEVLEAELEPDELFHVREVLTRSRGTSYRRVPTLLFQPSQNIGQIAGALIEKRKIRSSITTALRYANRFGARWEADLMSFIMLDGELASALLDLGRRDAWAKSAEVLTFFEDEPAT